MEDVDTIVIGSGVGGLTAALALARAGEKVVVLEQHDVPGGWCHSFRLGGHQFSPGVHYLGELGPGGRFRHMIEGLGLSEDITFLELNPNGYDRAIIGDQRFDIPKGKDVYADRLKSRFPHEAKGIDGYLDAVERMMSELNVAFKGRSKASLLTLPFRAPTLSRWGLVSIDRMLSSYVSDPLLKAILLIQAGDHGLGPKECPAAVHASIQAHYFDGGWYPRGGGQAIPRAFGSALRRHGGEIRLQTKVERILVEPGADGRRHAIGVRLADGTEIRARRVVSNADPGVTYGRMVDPVHLSAGLQKKLKKIEWSIASLSLFMAVDMDLKAAGCDSGNLWYSRDTNIQAGYDLAHADRIDVDEFPGQFLTVTSLKDPSKGVGTQHTCESFVFVSYEAFKNWVSTKFGDRPQDYQDMKEHLMDKMLRTADRMVPGLSKNVTFRDLGTPLTNQHYCMSTRGNLYGTAKTRWQVGPGAWPVRSEIAGLYMCGASTVSHGVMGAATSGLFAAAAALGCRSDELLRPGGKPLTMWPCDDLSKWPDDVRARIELKRAAKPAPVAVLDEPMGVTAEAK